MLPSHPSTVDPAPPWFRRSRFRAGIGWALLAHLLPSLPTVPVLGYTWYVAVLSPEPPLEGVFLWFVVILVIGALQAAVALGCLVAVIVAAAQRADDLAWGLAVGWLIGVAVVVVGSCGLAVLVRLAA